jgi:hypothetical protein
MGITTTLETETGEKLATVEDPTNLLHRTLPEPGARGFQWANTIDWYGDTSFNYLQVARLREEWSGLRRAARDRETVALLEAIDELLRRAESERHLYVKFYGD